MLGAKPFVWKWPQFACKSKLLFIWKRMSTRTRFEKQAKRKFGNSWLKFQGGYLFTKILKVVHIYRLNSLKLIFLSFAATFFHFRKITTIFLCNIASTVNRYQLQSPCWIPRWLNTSFSPQDFFWIFFSQRSSLRTLYWKKQVESWRKRYNSNRERQRK